MTISKGEGKTFDKIQYSFMTKNTQPTRNRKELPQCDKRHLEKPTANILLVDDSMFSPKIKNKSRMSALTTSVQHYTGDPRQGNKARTKILKFTDFKGRSKTISVH